MITYYIILAAFCAIQAVWLCYLISIAHLILRHIILASNFSGSGPSQQTMKSPWEAPSGGNWNATMPGQNNGMPGNAGWKQPNLPPNQNPMAGGGNGGWTAPGGIPQTSQSPV